MCMFDGISGTSGPILEEKINLAANQLSSLVD